MIFKINKLLKINDFITVVKLYLIYLTYKYLKSFKINRLFFKFRIPLSEHFFELNEHFFELFEHSFKLFEHSLIYYD